MVASPPNRGERVPPRHEADRHEALPRLWSPCAPPLDRLLAAIEGSLSTAELDQDLACAADAVSIVEACYESNKTGDWVDVLPL